MVDDNYRESSEGLDREELRLQVYVAVVVAPAVPTVLNWQQLEQHPLGKVLGSMTEVGKADSQDMLPAAMAYANVGFARPVSTWKVVAQQYYCFDTDILRT